jgi:hypothetical protein
MTLNAVFFRHASLQPLAVYPIRQGAAPSLAKKYIHFSLDSAVVDLQPTIPKSDRLLGYPVLTMEGQVGGSMAGQGVFQACRQARPGNQGQGENQQQAERHGAPRWEVRQRRSASFQTMKNAVLAAC